MKIKRIVLYLMVLLLLTGCAPKTQKHVKVTSDKYSSNQVVEIEEPEFIVLEGTPNAHLCATTSLKPDEEWAIFNDDGLIKYEIAPAPHGEMNIIKIYTEIIIDGDELSIKENADPAFTLTVTSPPPSLSELKRKRPSTDENITQIQAEIDANLQQNRGFAMGTLDEDGNPTDNGTPNPDFNWALFIYGIQYAENGITISVTEDFIVLPEHERDQIIRKAQNISMIHIARVKNLSGEQQVKARPFATVMLGNDTIGRSKLLDITDFKWFR